MAGALALLLLVPPTLAPVPDALHWGRSGLPAAVVVVYDATGSVPWGEALIAGATEWNANIQGVKLRVVTPAGWVGCNGAIPDSVVICVAPTSPGTRAETHWTVDDEEHLRSATIRMDPRPAPLYARLACHELGHALGLRHRESGPSCMVTGTDWTHPDAQDFRTVSEAHGHLHPDRGLWP